MKMQTIYSISKYFDQRVQIIVVFSYNNNPYCLDIIFRIIKHISISASVFYPSRFYSASFMHSSTKFFKFGFSIAAAIRSLSLICLFTANGRQKKSLIAFNSLIRIFNVRTYFHPQLYGCLS